jgi:phenylalanine-4-hydroxylase
LNQVLEEFINDGVEGGPKSVKKLIDSKTLGTIELLQVCKFQEIFRIIEFNGKSVYVQSTGETTLYRNKVVGHGLSTMQTVLEVQ